MEHIGIDSGKTSSQLCILTEDGEMIERRVKTTRDSFLRWLGQRAPACVLVEATTESEWVARCLEEMGHEVNRRRPELRAHVCDLQPPGQGRGLRDALGLKDAKDVKEAMKTRDAEDMRNGTTIRRPLFVRVTGPPLFRTLGANTPAKAPALVSARNMRMRARKYGLARRQKIFLTTARLSVLCTSMIALY